ncbi:hypothetical protein CPB83DRAFT_860383 [Crepidotus variabilis]|uniref:Uncharacterized protein n=1 Tax=Crepidotus variabilis TaxID=179855 RepID=A0A9P6JL65_9AGAR|nr:hypothetical protein CPB83DRAFT_860383 [Crepidotus variabilis]
MPILVYNSQLPLDFWDYVLALSGTMRNGFWYLTAFLAGSSVLPNAATGPRGANAQYLLGLGELGSCARRDRN